MVVAFKEQWISFWKKKSIFKLVDHDEQKKNLDEKKFHLYLVNKEKIKLEKKSYLYVVKKEKINWKNKSIFTLWKKRKSFGKINLSLPCEKREN
jgi:hypothetical protein